MKPETLFKRSFVAFPICAAALLVALVFGNPDVKSDPAGGANKKAAPEWELKDVDGKSIKSSDYKGKVVLLDFWATWCPPCRDEIPGFIELQKKYSDKGLVVVGVSLDEEGPKVVKPFMKKYKINYPIVMGDQKTVDAFGGVSGIPTTFVIDREGKLVTKHVGFAEKSVFEKEIKPLLEQK